MQHFFDLPLLIRNKIYRHALVMGRIFVRPFLSMEYLMDQERVETYGTPTLALLCTSKQVYKEAMPIYLSENIFSIVQVDILAAASRELPRVFQNFKKIRRVEIVFDSRDYIYMARFLRENLPTIKAAVQEYTNYDEFSDAHKAAQALNEMHASFDIPGKALQHQQQMGHPISPNTGVAISEGNYSPTSSVSSAHTGRKDPGNGSRVRSRRSSHRQHIENMKEYLWGRTLTFVRQTFRLSHLYVDLRHCTCVDGCCRLANEVMSWGWLRVWIHGMPLEVQVRGISRNERDVIASILDAQQLRQGLQMEDIFDQDRRMGHGVGLREYNEVLRRVQHRMGE